jgi:uncharacterized protein YggT (Ycf19 family)
MNDFWSYWYFHIPNFILAALMYTLMGRLLLGLVVPDGWDNYIWRFFKASTDPVLGVVRVATPSILTQPVVIIFAVLWLMALRVAYLVLLLNLGIAPLASQGV